jgi:hypothetical protein
MFFATDSVTMWLGRGIVWTLAFELLLVAFSPFELALWNTHRGERISQRVRAKRALLDHHSHRRAIGRRAGLAIGALTVPLALIAVGVGSHIPATHAAPTPRVTQVTRVVRVVKPVRVERVVKIKTVAQQVPSTNVYQAPLAINRTPVRKPAPRKKTTAKKPASSTSPVVPKAHVKTPSTSGQSEPSTPTGDTTSGAQTQAVPPTTGSSGAAAQPTT